VTVTCNSAHTECIVVFTLQSGYANVPHCYGIHIAYLVPTKIIIITALNKIWFVGCVSTCTNVGVRGLIYVHIIYWNVVFLVLFFLYSGIKIGHQSLTLFFWECISKVFCRLIIILAVANISKIYLTCIYFEIWSLWSVVCGSDNLDCDLLGC
jgi:hypothetical protein